MIFPDSLVSNTVRRSSSYLVAGLGAVALGVAIGLATAQLPILIYAVVGGILAALFGLQLIQRSHWTVSAFFLALTLQTTLLTGFEVRGLYYPIYLIMLFNAIAGLVTQRVKVSSSIVITYLLFYLLVIISLFQVSTGLNFELFQKLFIYLLGLIVSFQFTSEKSFWALARVQTWSGLIVAAWVIIGSIQTGFAGRGISEINQNNVATLIAFGLIPLFATQLSGKAAFWRRSAGWLALALGIYAILLLASRGMTVALGMALVLMFARILNNPRRSVPLILLATVGALVLASLPGSSNLAERFTQADVASANGRTPLWNAAVHDIETSSPLQLLFGHGINYSWIVTNRVVGFYYSVHNAYLQMTLEFGLVGLGLFLALHFIALRLLWRFNDGLSLYGTGAVTFLLFSNLTNVASDAFFYWVTLGAVLALAVWRHQSQVEREPNSLPSLQIPPPTATLPK
jgi:O-antigen ligase